MLKNYIITAFRNLRRNRSYTIINVFGLALGISAALVLFKVVLFEKSFDQFESNKEQIYRVTKKDSSPNLVELEGAVQDPFAKAFETDYPEFGEAVRVMYTGDGQISVKDAVNNWTHFQQDDGIAFVEQEYFDLFDHEWIVGNPEKALTQPKTVVLTVPLVEKYFGITDGGFDRVLGQQIKLDNELELMVSGVVADPPKNSSNPFTIFIDYASVEDFWDFYQKDSWGSTSSNAQVYILLDPSVTEAQVEAVFPEFVEKYIPEGENKTEFALQPLLDIHFQPEYNTFGDHAVDSGMLTAPIAIALFLILTACINFINLSTALAIKRAKEVGVRKVLGGVRSQLIFQFLGETFLITLLAVFISMGIAELMLTNLDDVIGRTLSLNLLEDVTLLWIVLGITFGVTLLAGLYPSLILSRLSLVSVLRSKGQSAISGNINTRRGLVVFQFFISQVLVICTLVVVSQMNYFENQDLGFRKTSILTFPLPERDDNKMDLMRNELMSFSGVEDVSFAFASPMSNSNIGSTFNYDPLGSTEMFDAAYKVIDQHYLDLYDIDLLAGRDISENDTTLSEALVSEAVLKVMGIASPEDAIGEVIQTGFGGDKRIVGVIEDFHNKNLKQKPDPLIMVSFSGYFYEGAVRFEGSDAQSSALISRLENVWMTQFPDVIFDYNMLSDEILENYETESNMLTLFQVFSGVAILIGCLGLYGLVSFMANQKTKEIGIRKVLGASVSQILVIFSKEIFILIGVAFVIATPLAFYVISDWLNNFEYRIDIGAWVFVAAIVFTVLVGAITTGLRSFQAATSNPVDSLRSE